MPFVASNRRVVEDTTEKRTWKWDVSTDDGTEKTIDFASISLEIYGVPATFNPSPPVTVTGTIEMTATVNKGDVADGDGLTFDLTKSDGSNAVVDSWTYDGNATIDDGGTSDGDTTDGTDGGTSDGDTTDGTDGGTSDGDGTGDGTGGSSGGGCSYSVQVQECLEKEGVAGTGFTTNPATYLKCGFKALWEYVKCLLSGLWRLFVAAVVIYLVLKTASSNGGK